MELKSISLIFLISTLIFASAETESDEFEAITKMLGLKSPMFLDLDSLLAGQNDVEQEKFATLLFDDCSDVTANNMPSGVYNTRISNGYGYSQEKKVYCDTKTWGGNWTVILQRVDGSVIFYRDWERYTTGFGDIEGDGEFMLGLQNIHYLTAERSQELLVLLEDENGTQAYESYEKFAISNNDEGFALNTLGKANGTAGDSLSYHHGQKFTTYDRNNGPQSGKNCAQVYHSAWWHNDCHKSNLAGNYGNNTFGMGINWYTFRGHYQSLKRAVMMIRPRK